MRAIVDNFVRSGQALIASVEKGRPMEQLVRLREAETNNLVDETSCAVSDGGCAIEEIVASPSGRSLATHRLSGQGEWLSVENDRIEFELYGGVNFSITGPPPPTLLLPTPHPAGRAIL
jgi:hypothetical protein